MDRLVINRHTYHILEWLGDIGGLADALKYIGAFFAGPIATYALESNVLASLFIFRKSMKQSTVDGTNQEFEENRVLKKKKINNSGKTFESDEEEEN